MSPTSQRMRTVCLLGVVLIAVPVLDLAFKLDASAEVAAFCLFILLFIALLLLGMLVESFWSSRAGDKAELDYFTKEE